MDNEDLWFELLKHGSEDELEWLRNLVKDEMSFNASIRVLCEHGLVEQNARNDYEAGSKGYSVHACVHSWMKAVLNAQHDEELASAALRCVALHVPVRWEYSVDSWPIRRRLLNHANRVCRYEGGYAMDTVGSRILLGGLYLDLYKLSRAEEMFLNVAETRAQSSSLELRVPYVLSAVYKFQGRLPEAEALLTQTVIECEKAFGPEDDATLSFVNILATAFEERGRRAEAEKLLTRALVGHEKYWGQTI